ncbi:polymerase PA [Sesbania bispinosa]|nr:polymerase PA [Sesbania bispinosa]
MAEFGMKGREKGKEGLELAFRNRGRFRRKVGNSLPPLSFSNANNFISSK